MLRYKFIKHLMTLEIISKTIYPKHLSKHKAYHMLSHKAHLENIETHLVISNHPTSLMISNSKYCP